METPNEITPNEAIAQEAQPVIDQEKLNVYMEIQKLDQNFPMALMAGLLAALVGAIAWAAVSVTTGYQIGYMAIGIGLLVSYAVRYFGKGFDQIFGITGAALALLSCLMGNLFSIIGFAAQVEGMGYSQIFSILNFSLVTDLMIDSFSPMDLLFYGLAAYEGYKFSFRKLTEEEILANGTK